MKLKKIRPSSFAAAFAAWLLLLALSAFIVWQIRDRARLIRDNDNERIFNILFAGLRNYDDFDSVVRSNPVLYERIIGIAVYGNNLRPLYGWGKVPPFFDETLLSKTRPGRFGRYTIPDRRGSSVKFVLRGAPQDHHAPGAPPPGQGGYGAVGPMPNRRMQERQGPPFFNTLLQGRYFYIDLYHPEYWRVLTLSAVALPLWGLALLFLVFYIRHLYLRNREYRGRIEAQQNLVVLGTAASTLAHEIKNPLLSIRLQTGILEKTGGGKEEIQIINQEVERLSALIYRVNDYLREPEGNKTLLGVRDLLAETSRRICGRNLVTDDSAEACILADEDRIRSVLENLLRNALEAGGTPEEIGASVNRGGADGNGVVIRIFDRGKGLEEKNLKRVFDPFFTSKSTGTGIGLAVSRRFTEAAGGSIRAENREGGGLVVTLTFPDYNESSRRKPAGLKGAGGGKNHAGFDS
ncbi:MAG: HAMP domain-containing histidine kinase [Treponema sp.]|jgi:two-component system sensor histidine kinase HydH|nr:HAMP domain-containing histidine kinase [Treponema sp.]